MKKFLLAAVLIMVSASAMADRMASGSSFCDTDYYCIDRVSSTFKSKADACGSAKSRISPPIVSSDEQVESYSKCDCDQDKKGGWSCSVDAKVEKKH